MVKICFVTTVPFGLEHFMLPIVKELHKTGKFDISFVCNRDDEFAKRLPEWIHYFPVKMKRGIDPGFLRIISQLKRIFKKNRFDIVAYSNENASLYASIAARLAHTPVRLYNQWGVRHRNMKKGLKRHFYKTIEKVICKCSTDTRPQSRLHQTLCIQERLITEQNSKVLGLGGTIGVDLQDFDIAQKAAWREEFRKKVSLPSSAFVFGFIGRLTKDKGICEILEAFDKLEDESPLVYLLLVGDLDVNNGFSEQDKKIIGSNDRIICTGRLPKEEVKFAYSAMDVYVHPSYREGFGLAIQEAGAMALPVITTRIPGASEVLVEGESCLLVPIQSPEQLYLAMADLLNDPEKTKSFGAAARQRVEREFERSKMVGRQVEDYLDLASRFNGRTSC